MVDNCFIRRNDKEVRDVLDNLGFKKSSTFNESANNIWVCGKYYYNAIESEVINNAKVGVIDSLYGYCCGDDIYELIDTLVFK